MEANRARCTRPIGYLLVAVACSGCGGNGTARPEAEVRFVGELESFNSPGEGESVDVIVAGSNGEEISITFPPLPANPSPQTLTTSRARVTVDLDDLRCNEGSSDPVETADPGARIEVVVDVDSEPTAEEVPHMMARSVVVDC